MPRWAAKVDGTHKEVVDALNDTGWTVLDVSRAPLTVDLIIAKGQRVVLVEVKSKTGKLTKAQAYLFWHWPAEVAVLRSVDDVLKLNHAKQGGQRSDRPRRQNAD